ncbi:hypothetical protein RB195_017495 [Necator americanus]|uniref:Uncharacterized protein n=1 Tax=Necator americanus TaxID=51031 RepID=A0ABR1C7E7_NECAM
MFNFAVDDIVSPSAPPLVKLEYDVGRYEAFDENNENQGACGRLLMPTKSSRESTYLRFVLSWCMETLYRQLPGYFWPMVCYSEELPLEVNMV